jgi:hypothetical protein
MNRQIQLILRRSGLLIALVIATAITLGMATPANAQKSPDAVTAFFDPSTGVLTILGDQQNNTLTVNRDAAGSILVNGGAVQVTGGTLCSAPGP